MLLKFILTILGHALAVQAHILSSHEKRPSRPGEDIGALCAGHIVDLTTLSQLRQLNELAPSSGCSDIVKRGIAELLVLIERNQNNVCSPESIGELVQYYQQYLDTSAAPGDESKLPKSLKRLALAYGMQVSNLCEQTMVVVLAGEERAAFRSEDFGQFKPLLDDKGPVAEMLDSLTGPNEVLLPGELATLFRAKLSESDKARERKFYLETMASSYLIKLKLVCQRRFKPLYEPLMEPLVRLANLGLTYRNARLKKNLNAGAMAKWSRVVFICESLENIRVVREPYGYLGPLRVVTRAEAEARGRDSAEEELKNGQLAPPAADKVAGPLSHVAPVRVGDLVYDWDDAKLRKAVESFKTDASEEDLIRARLWRRGLAMIKQNLRQGNIGLLVSAAYKSLLRRVKGGRVESPSDQLVRLLDDLVDRERNGKPATLAARVRHNLPTVAACVLVIGMFTFFLFVASVG